MKQWFSRHWASCNKGQWSLRERTQKSCPVTVQLTALREFPGHDIDEKNPCEGDGLPELRIQDQGREPQSKELNRKNCKDLEWVSIGIYTDQHMHWVNYQRPRKESPKRSWGNSSGCSHRANQTEKNPWKLTGHWIKHLDSLLGHN